MKLKQALILVVLLVIIFLIATSFYYRFINKGSAKDRLIYNVPPRYVSFCAPPFIETNPVNDIPALKGWGNYSFKISTASDSAQFYFNQGLSLYYGFHMIEAYASFTKASRIDSSCAMAWYGKALAMGPTINYPNGYKEPYSTVQVAFRSKLLAANCTPLETDLINAIQERYSNDTAITVKQLRSNYANAMQKVYVKYSKNADVITLYADALLLLHPWDLYTHDFKPKSWTPLIRLLLEQALEISPKHPGANHYYIHTIEASAHPQTALKSANLLATLMPSVSHITHMPSHIYIRTGNYKQGILVNDAAVAGYKNYLKAYGPTVDGQVLYEAHNIHLKINCAQMGGNYKDAAEGSTTLQAQVPLQYIGLKSADGNYYQYIYMQPTLTAVRFGKWDDVLMVKQVDSLPYASVLQHFSRGIAYCRKGNTTLAKKELAKLEEKMQDKTLKLAIDNFSTPYEASCVARLILKGVLATNEKQYTTAINYLQKAVIAEDNLIYNEPRDWPLPVRQYLGDVLIKAGKYNQAIEILNKDLFINPNNGWALTGLKLAYQNTNNIVELKKVEQRLVNAWKIKDIAIEQPVF
jgi:tetratricopeptide (TPR) repeat protein